MRRYWAIGAVVLLAAFLRLHGLGRESIWFDEALTLWLSKMPYRQMLENMKYYEQTPPLNHILTGWFIWLFGDSETVLRLPAALAGIGAVAGIYAVGRRIGGEQLGLIAALLLAVNPYAIYYAKEARGYSLILCLSLLSTHAFLIMLKAFPRGRVYYVATTALMLYAHPFGAMVVLCHMVAWVHAQRNRATGMSFGKFVFVLTIVGLLYLPWLPILRLAMQLTGSGFWIPPLHVDDLTAAYWIYSNTAGALVMVIAIGVAGCAVARKRSEGIAVMLLAMLPVVIPVMASIVLHRPMFTPRYGIAAVGGISLLVAIGLMAMNPRARAVLLVMLIAMMVAGPGPAPESPGFNREKQPWREIGGYLRDHVEPGKLVMYSPGFTKIHFDYYVRREDVRQVAFQDSRAYPEIREDHFWLIVSNARPATYAFLRDGGYRVEKRHVVGEMMILEMRRDAR